MSEATKPGMPPVLKVFLALAILAAGGVGYEVYHTYTLAGGTVTAAPGVATVAHQSSADACMAVALVSEKGVDYTALQGFIAANEWRKADRETYERLLQAAGPASLAAGSVTQAEMNTLPAKDLWTVNNLWQKGSKDRYGFKTQEDLLIEAKQNWVPFYTEVGWIAKDGSKAVTFSFDPTTNRYNYNHEPEWRNLRMGELPTFERNYNHEVSLDKRLAEVAIK